MGERAHLSIGEVLSQVQEDFPDVTISKIRFLESQGLLDPERTPSGYRKFYDHDIERLVWILAQQRDNFLPLKVIRERLDEWDATGTAPVADHQTPLAADLPGGADPERQAPANEPEAAGAAPAAALDDTPTDARHAAAFLAASSAVEVLTHGEQATGVAPTDAPAPAADVAMEAAPRVDAPRHEGPPADDALRVGPSSTSLTAEELAERAGIPVAAVRDLESFSMIESRRIGPDAYFEADALVVAEACRSFLEHGVEVRHLRMYKIAAEREAGVFEQLVMPLLKQRNPEARARAVAMVGSLGEAGEALHAALLRSALSDTLP